MESDTTSQPTRSGGDAATMRSCAYCRNSGGELLFGASSTIGDSFRYACCHRCHAVFITPRPTAEQLDRAYDENYYGKGSSKFFPVLERVIEYWRRGRSRRVARLLKPGARIIDIGCGNGQFGSFLIDQGFEVWGTEHQGKASSRAAKITGLTLKLGEVYDLELPTQHFDAVTMWHVIEHLGEPQRVLDRIQQLVRPGGYFLFSLPNIESIQARIFGPHWFHLDPPRHIWFLGASTLRSEVERRGFAMVSQRFFSLEYNPYGYLQSILNMFFRNRDELYESLKSQDSSTGAKAKLGIIGQKIIATVLLPFCILFSLVEAMLRRGGTVEFVFRKL